MPSAEVLDFVALVKPIPGPSPTGIDLRADSSNVSLYELLKEDRKAARQNESRIDKGDRDLDGKAPPPPDWRPLVQRATRILEEQSKDLEVAAYLIEGLVRLHGFAGLRDGYRLVRELLDAYWDDGLYPVSADTNVETRFALLLQLNGIDGPGSLLVPIAKVPFTEKTSAGEISKVHYQEAQSFAKLTDPKTRQARLDAGTTTNETIQKAVAETPAEFYHRLFDDMSLAREEFLRCCRVLKEKSGYDPPSANIQDALESYTDIVKDLARSKAKPVSTSPPSAPDGAELPPPVVVTADGKIRDRDDALAKLVKIADYFREAEPQSIIPYALEQVVHWGKLSLPELLSELISDEGPRKSVFKQVGIRPPESK